ncbi:hypothetical protein [Photobacterium rosenbergii]|uniref:DUF2987 domain-containing protein n=1 Tax=Photobacterium rosenbergii TaxID=294936 RepID=A0ABU3ZD34_9GAMM|nr:hypothetical protein [Photobacterium rosenbergii]MDV5168020.1 hypothetical protein [Photobacterium rosenbergii]
MPLVFPFNHPSYLAAFFKKSACYLFILSAALVLFSPLSSANLLQQDFEFGDSVDYMRSLPEGFDCSALYQTDDDVESEGGAFCFDQTNLFNTKDGMLTAFILEGGVDSVEYRLEMSLANYNAVLAGLRRQNFVFAQVTVGSETLDVLSGLKVLDQQTLDDQLFTLANHSDFSVRREFILLDHRSFKRAVTADINSVDSWLEGNNPQRGFERLTLVRVIVKNNEILLQVSQPFSD